MTQQRQGLAFKPVREDPLRDIVRAGVVLCWARMDPRQGLAPAIARRLYGDAADAVVRATSTPATTTDPAWAAPLVGTAYGPFLAGIKPRSAAAKLAELAMRIDLTGVGSVLLPGFVTRFTRPPWVAEGAPMPVVIAQMGSVAIGPSKKVAFGVTITNELTRFTAANAEQVVRAGLVEAASLALDATMLSADPATADAPAGIFHGVAPIPGAAGGGLGAVSADLGAMAGQIADAGGGARLAVVAAPAQAIALAMLAPASSVPVFASAALPSGTVGMLDVAALATSFAPLPRLEASTESVIHESDTPLEIASPGSPATVAAPGRSLWQTDSVNLRCIWPATWAVRDPGLVAWIEDATW